MFAPNNRYANTQQFRAAPPPTSAARSCEQQRQAGSSIFNMQIIISNVRIRSGVGSVEAELGTQSHVLHSRDSNEMMKYSRNFEQARERVPPHMPKLQSKRHLFFPQQQKFYRAVPTRKQRFRQPRRIPISSDVEFSWSFVSAGRIRFLNILPQKYHGLEMERKFFNRNTTGYFSGLRNPRNFSSPSGKITKS